ncbi:MAG: anthranilate phosphoribosyltransferase, partial [Pseudomonadota bacterium]
LAEALAALGSEHVLVIHARDGLDEFSIASPTDVAELNRGEVTEWVFDPASTDCAGALDGLQVNNASDSLTIIRSALSGEPGPAANIIALNAGAALYVAGQADSMVDGIVQARAILASGRGLKLLQAYADWSQTG